MNYTEIFIKIYGQEAVTAYIEEYMERHLEQKREQYREEYGDAYREFYREHYAKKGNINYTSGSSQPYSRGYTKTTPK
jgi:hypothetical protein